MGHVAFNYLYYCQEYYSPSDSAKRKYELWTYGLDSGLDCGLDFGLDFGPDFLAQNAKFCTCDYGTLILGHDYYLDTVMYSPRNML